MDLLSQLASVDSFALHIFDSHWQCQSLSSSHGPFLSTGLSLSAPDPQIPYDSSPHLCGYRDSIRHFPLGTRTGLSHLPSFDGSIYRILQAQMSSSQRSRHHLRTQSRIYYVLYRLKIQDRPNSPDRSLTRASEAAGGRRSALVDKLAYQYSIQPYAVQYRTHSLSVRWKSARQMVSLPHFLSLAFLS